MLPPTNNEVKMNQTSILCSIPPIWETFPVRDHNLFFLHNWNWPMTSHLAYIFINNGFVQLMWTWKVFCQSFQDTKKNCGHVPKPSIFFWSWYIPYHNFCLRLWYPEKQPTCRKSLTTLSHVSSTPRHELDTNLQLEVVIDTAYTGSCKSNYDAIMTTTAPSILGPVGI